jgi:hypothetical protein
MRKRHILCALVLAAAASSSFAQKKPPAPKAVAPQGVVAAVRVVAYDTEAVIKDSDCLLVNSSSVPIGLTLPEVSKSPNGRVLVFKTVVGGADFKISGTDLGEVSVEEGKSITVVASKSLNAWLVVGKM